jgi:hypothetical protein
MHQPERRIRLPLWPCARSRIGLPPGLPRRLDEVGKRCSTSDPMDVVERFKRFDDSKDLVPHDYLDVVAVRASYPCSWCAWLRIAEQAFEGCIVVPERRPALRLWAVVLAELAILLLPPVRQALEGHAGRPVGQSARDEVVRLLWGDRVVPCGRQPQHQGGPLPPGRRRPAIQEGGMLNE